MSRRAWDGMFRGCGRGGLLSWLGYSSAFFLCATVGGLSLGRVFEVDVDVLSLTAACMS